MLIMRIKIRGVFFLMLLLFFYLSGCSLTPQFWVLDESDDYEEYTDHDDRELAEQITDYWRYKEISEKN